MSKKFLEFDPKNFRFGKVKINLGKILFQLFLYLIVTLAISALVYLTFAMFFKTDVERRLRKEIQVYKSIYPELSAKEELLRDAIANLQYEDNEIYEEIFSTTAPATDPMAGLDFMFASDTIPDTKLTSYARDKSDALLAKSAKIESSFRKIFAALQDSSTVIPPMSLPVKDISYPQVGASVGRKLDPFYRAYVYHEGLDLILSRGTDVLASADAVVLEIRNTKQFGRTVTLSHQGGYTSVYAHLESVSVRKGHQVKRGQKIGEVGISGKSFAPHLHYEIHRDSVSVDPVHYFFATVGPAEYANMLYMTVNTMQSMD